MDAAIRRREQFSRPLEEHNGKWERTDDWRRMPPSCKTPADSLHRTANLLSVEAGRPEEDAKTMEVR
ncbi:MAG: hypothetical protein WB817_11460 [Terriglobales bacterium]